jgi:hypothetical protein
MMIFRVLVYLVFAVAGLVFGAMAGLVFGVAVIAAFAITFGNFGFGYTTAMVLLAFMVGFGLSGAVEGAMVADELVVDHEEDFRCTGMRSTRIPPRV